MPTKFLLYGKEINLTSDDVIIKSTNFSVDKNGKVICNNIAITGGKINVSGAGTSTDLIRVTNSNNSSEFSYIQPVGAGFVGTEGRIDINVAGNNFDFSNIDIEDNYGLTSIYGEHIITPKIYLRDTFKGLDYSAVFSSTGNSNYVGTGGDYNGMITILRGNTVRLYAHSGGGVYLGASGSTAVTSDETQKDIYEIDDKYVQFFKNLKPITYIYKNKGHRNHIGFGARQVEEALTKAGLTTEQFAGILKDKDITILADEMGTDKDVHFDELYSLRYEEFIALNTLMIQKILKKLEE